MAIIDVDKLKSSGRRFASDFTTGQKAVTIAAVVGVVLAMFMFSKWENKPTYAPLFTNLDSKSAGEVTQSLNSQGVKYKLTDGGATVMVSQNQVYQLRATMATKGVPSAQSDGWSIMDKGGITQDSFTRSVDYQRALQTELAKTIDAIDGVSSASVTLSIPQQSVFVDATDSQSTAAVLVTPMTSTSLTAEKVQAIVNLVSSAVPNLSPDKVTVADSLGNVLSAPGQNGALANSQQLSQTTAFDTSLGNTIQTLIAQSLGPGHAAVTVNSALDFSKTTTTSDSQQPTVDKKGKQVADSSTSSTETFSGPSGSSAGVLGPTGTPLTTGSPNQSYKKTETQANWAVNQVHKEVQNAPGSITKLSVSAILDSSKVSQADINKWTQIISSAAGITKSRGDVLAVNLVPFDQTAAKAQAAQVKDTQSAASQNFLLNLVRYLATLLIVGFVLFFAYRSVKRSAAISAPIRVPLDLRELEAGDLVGDRADTSYDRTALPDGSPRARPLEAPRSSIEDDLNALIEQQPDEVAQTLRSWLADRRT
jgi:flagellar M-ring protein FliF